MMNLLYFFSIAEIIDGDYDPPQHDPPWATQDWVKKEDYITESPVRLFTDIFKSLPEEVEEVLDEMIRELDRPDFYLRSNGSHISSIFEYNHGEDIHGDELENYYNWLRDKVPFSLRVANLYRNITTKDNVAYIPAIAIGACFLFIASAALLGYLF